MCSGISLRPSGHRPIGEEPFQGAFFFPGCHELSPPGPLELGAPWSHRHNPHAPEVSATPVIRKPFHVDNTSGRRPAAGGALVRVSCCPGTSGWNSQRNWILHDSVWSRS